MYFSPESSSPGGGLFGTLLCVSLEVSILGVEVSQGLSLLDLSMERQEHRHCLPAGRESPSVRSTSTAGCCRSNRLPAGEIFLT